MPILNRAFLGDQIKARMAELVFKPSSNGDPTPLKLYQEKPDLSACPAQQIDHSYAVRYRRIRNTKEQRPRAGWLHVTHTFEVQIAKRVSGKNYDGEQAALAARAEQIVSAFVMKSLGGLDVDWEDTSFPEDLVNAVIYATLTFTAIGFWRHSAQHSS